MTAIDLETQRQTILHYWNHGVHSAKEIHILTKIPIQTIYYNLRKLEKTGTTMHKKGAGRPLIITAYASRTIGQYVRRNPTISLRTLVTKISRNGVDVSRETVRRHMHNSGYQKNVPKATPMLTETHKAKRVEWAQKHLNDDWTRTLFTDETAFKLFRNTVKHWYKSPRPTRPIPKDRTKIFAWGGFCIKGKTSLFCFKNIMDAKFYVSILEKHIPEVSNLMGNRWRFQQDNDPKHMSRLAKSFLQEKVPEVIDWPSNSPDLNPIENLWNIVKRNVEKRMPKNCDELVEFMVEEWNSIPKSTLINLVSSMRDRCELIIEKHGERIPY